MVIGLTMDNILNSIMYFMTKKAKKMRFLSFMKGKTLFLPKRKTNIKNKEHFQKFNIYSFRIFHIYDHYLFGIWCQCE